jgi:hypothetical protein
MHVLSVVQYVRTMFFVHFAPSPAIEVYLTVILASPAPLLPCSSFGTVIRGTHMLVAKVRGSFVVYLNALA